MGRPKRPLEVTHADGDAQPPTKRRAEHPGVDVQLAKLYDDLADEVEAVRLGAAKELLQNLWQKSPERQKRVDNAIRRLVRGLCSGRKAARLGFSVALPELLRLNFNSSHERQQSSQFGLTALMKNIVDWTRADGGAKGQEKRDHLLGRRFAYQAILQSDVALNKDLPNSEWRELIECIFELAKLKQWVRRDCGAMLHNYLTSPSGSRLEGARVQTIIDVLGETKQLKTPEGVGLWITIRKLRANVSFPKNVWHHNDPLSARELPLLGKVMLENANDDDSDGNRGGYRQSTPSFAWSVILEDLYRQEYNTEFERFWISIVAAMLFAPSASVERKALGLQVFSLAITSAPLVLMEGVFQPIILRCIVDQRTNKDKYLSEAAKIPLSDIIKRVKADQLSAAVFVKALLLGGVVYLDQIMKLKIMDSIIEVANDEGLSSITFMIQNRVMFPGLEVDALAETMRRAMADIILLIVRSKKRSEMSTNKMESPDWLQSCFLTLAEVAYLKFGTVPDILSSTREVYRSRLMSCLTLMMDSNPYGGFWAPGFIVDTVANPRMEKLSSINTKETRKVLGRAEEHLKQAIEEEDRAFSSLLALSIIQVYNGEIDAVGVLEDAVSCYESKGKDVDSSITLIELLLSFVSRPSALFRKLAEQVFSAFAADMTAESLQSLLDILAQKEGLAGQQELFQQNGDEQAEEVAENEENSISDNDGYEDVEDVSDLEIVNGFVASDKDADSESGSNEEDSASSSDTSEEDEDGSSDNDEEAAFDRKLAEALGTNGKATGSDSDESGMDDEQMMALEPHLNKIFEERAKQTSKAKDRKDARENIINFKNRVLDLLTIYVKSQYANILALDILYPFVVLVRTTTSRPTAEKAFGVMKQYFDSCTKHKSLPVPASAEDCFALLAALQGEMKHGGGAKLHANACSRASLFLSKVLCSADAENYNRIADMYVGLLKEWRADPKCHVQQSVFTEWMSWSIETRKRE